MRIDKQTLHASPSPRERPIRSSRRTIRSRWPVLLTLVVMIAGLGLLLVRLLLGAVSATPDPAPAPQPTRAVSPTPEPTPTATSPEVVDTLETLYIDVAPDDFAQIVATREEALERGILLSSNDDAVPATLRYRQQQMPAEIRLKGDWLDHYAFDKWSFRVEMEGDHYLLGMKNFSVQGVARRAYLNEWLFMQHLQSEGVLTVRYHFVHVVLNGEYKGIYALEEGFTKELLEFQQRRESVIIRYAEDLMWEYRAAYENDEVVPRALEEIFIVDEFETAKVNEDPVLAAQRDVAIGHLRAFWRGELPASVVFDPELMGKFLALVDFWGAEHSLIWHNLRFYYNPVTTQLEPIAFDAHPLATGVNIDLHQLEGLRQTIMYGDPRLQRAYLHHLWRISRPSYLEKLKEHFGTDFASLHTALAEEFGEENLSPPWDVLARRQDWLRELLTPYQMLYAYVPTSTSEQEQDTLPLDVGNVLDFPVEILGLQVGETWVPARHDWVTPVSQHQVVSSTMVFEEALILPPLPLDAAFMDYVHLRVPLEESAQPSILDLQSSPELKLVTRVWGLTRTFTQPVISAYPPVLDEGPRPSFPEIAEVLETHPYLQRVEDEMMFRIPAGTWDIQSDLILPRSFGLELAPGTTLRFGAEIYLLTSGPLRFQGTEAQPITLEPLGDQWRGIVVLNAEIPSRWRHVTVRNTNAITQPGWTLTGGITFYNSALYMDQSRILGTRAEDALNVIESTFEFTNSEFAQTASDAFDADFGQGMIEQCVFRDIAADGIDVSGSEVTVRAVRMLDLGDKGLSVGEASRMTVEDLVVERANFGIVSKDLSTVTAHNVTLEGVRWAGLAAYIKKPAYGPASITADDVVFVDTPDARRTLVQTKSWIDLNGVRIWGVAVDVDALYDQ